MSRTTTYTVQVTFGDCDPAGIVFFPNFSRIMASTGCVSSKFHVTSSFMKNPPMTTLPFSPRMLIDPSRSFGLVAVVASSTPRAPLNGNRFPAGL